MMELPGMNNHVIEIARSWIGTPYKHRACCKGAGCDCIGLIIGIWQELYKSTPQDWKLPQYTPMWAEETGLQLMVDTGKKYLQEVPVGAQQPGDILMFRMRRKGPTKHAAILSTSNRVIHAYSGHAVCEVPMINSKGVLLTHVFRFPTQVN